MGRGGASPLAVPVQPRAVVKAFPRLGEEARATGTACQALPWPSLSLREMSLSDCIGAGHEGGAVGHDGNDHLCSHSELPDELKPCLRDNSRSSSVPGTGQAAGWGDPGQRGPVL